MRCLSDLRPYKAANDPADPTKQENARRKLMQDYITESEYQQGMLEYEALGGVSKKSSRAYSRRYWALCICCRTK